MKSGYPDGANARWRTLYELSVVSSFLSKRDNGVSERYLDYDSVIRCKAARYYQEYCKKLGDLPFKEEEIEEIKNEKQRLCEQKYDKEFCRDGGWIPDDIKNRKIPGLANMLDLTIGFRSTIYQEQQYTRFQEVSIVWD